MIHQQATTKKARGIRPGEEQSDLVRLHRNIPRIVHVNNKEQTNILFTTSQVFVFPLPNR